MQPVLSAEQIREIDRLTVENYHTSSLLLMEAASAACMEAIRARLDSNLASKKALILCGKGNNGGDGAALARALSRTGMHCSVVLFGKFSETSGDARTNFESVARLASFEAGSHESPPHLRLSSVRVSARGNNWQSRAARTTSSSMRSLGLV